MTNQPYLLALNRMNGMGPRTIAKLLVRWPQLDELFVLPAAQLELLGLPKAIAHAISSFDMRQIEADLRWQEKAGHFLLTWCSPNYPTLLKEIHDPPPVLYAMGNLDVFQQPMLAMVGSRKPSVLGGETAHRFAFELAEKDITIVSGLALGIDAQAHGGCLDAKGKTIAVMGTGIDLIYPYRHRQLADKIKESGLLLSELPLKSPPIAGHFPRRNRIISGLSLATLVVEAAVKSGSLITARMALEQNRDVLAIPGSIYNSQSQGCHYLLQQGATLAASSQDVLDVLGIKAPSKPVELALALARENSNLVKCLGFELTTVDQLIARSGFSVEKVVCDLVDLELKGIVKAVPGGYMRCMI
jgi:DNA processing protein